MSSSFVSDEFLENYLNFRNIKLTDNYFFKVIINLFQIIFAPSCFIFTVIDFSLPCIRYKSSQNLIYLAFSANAFLATGSIMLVIAIYLKSNINKNKIQAIQIITSDSFSNKLLNKEDKEAKKKGETNENELVNNKVNLNSFELIKTQRTITDLIINISPINEISEENEGRVTHDTETIQKPVNIIEINQESKEVFEKSGMIKDRNLNGIFKTFDKSIQIFQKPEKIVDLLLVKMPAIDTLDTAEVMTNQKSKILEEDEENNEIKQEPTKANNLINIAREVFEKSGEMKNQLDELINKNKNLSEIINTLDKSIQMIQKPEKIADLIVDKSLKISSNDILVKTKGILNGKISLDHSSEITKTNEVFGAELPQKQITNDLKTTENYDDYKNEDQIKSCKILIIILIKLISMIILMGYFSFSLYLFGYMTIQANGILTGLQNFAMILNIASSFLIDFIITKKT